MKVLVATTMRQRRVDDDFCYTIDGELVRLLFLECDCGDACGCTPDPLVRTCTELYSTEV